MPSQYTAIARVGGTRLRRPVRRTEFLYNIVMPVETTYTQLRADLASILDRVVKDQDVVIVRRRSGKDVALIPAAELAGVIETAHLLRSPKNAERLLRALRRAEKGEGKPETVDKLRREMGLEKDR
jgi:antitoxin YefM